MEFLVVFSKGVEKNPGGTLEESGTPRNSGDGYVVHPMINHPIKQPDWGLFHSPGVLYSRRNLYWGDGLLALGLPQYSIHQYSFPPGVVIVWHISHGNAGRK